MAPLRALSAPVLAVVATLLLAACGSTRPTTAPPELGIDWAKAPDVERPGEGFVIASDRPEPEGTGRSGHPMHFAGQAMMADVVATSAGLVAVGYVYPGWTPVAWTSADGATWRAVSMGDAPFTFPVSVAVGGSGRLVAGGRSGPEPIAWTSDDGSAWVPHRVPTLGTDGTAERITTVVATADGFLAGGSVGPELFERRARFWRSRDGAAWEPVADGAAFSDAEVRAIVSTPDGLVAVGVTGSAQRATGSVAWRSPDGIGWTRIDDDALSAGRAVALVVAPWGGLVAAGSDLDEGEALAWTSTDGSAWALAPTEPSRRYPGKIRFTDLVAIGDAVVGVGNYVGLQFGTATSWISHDGIGWTKARDAPVQQQGEMYALAPGGPGIVAVGSYGAPDNYIPTVWLSPAR